VSHPLPAEPVARPVHPITAELERDGIVVLPGLVTGDALKGMQEAFASRLVRMRWNDGDGFEKTERYRHMVQDVLTLDQGFVDVALHPVVKQVLAEYLGPRFQLVEAKGWRSLPTKTDFHGWHGDAWYDQTVVREIPREIKLAVYLTDVKSGAFHYIKGSHRKQHPRPVRDEELGVVPEASLVAATGSAGTGILFDTSGIHRQGMPILEPRHAVFLNYHDAGVPLQQEDLDYYRYHPLLLNAAFLGNLSEEDRRILGFGDKQHLTHAFIRRARYPRLEAAFRLAFETTLRVEPFADLPRRLYRRLRRLARGA
jgi:Phytanoyl-CoA dioxygenase (PhyH)